MWSKMCIGLHTKHPTFFSEFNERDFSVDFREKKNSNIKFHENPSSGSRDSPCGQTDRLTDMTKLIVALRYFATAPKNAR